MNTLDNRREWVVSITKEDYISTVNRFGVPAKLYNELLFDNCFYGDDDSVVVIFKAGDMAICFTNDSDEAVIEYGDWSKETSSKAKIRRVIDFILELGQADELTEEQDLEAYRLYKSIK